MYLPTCNLKLRYFSSELKAKRPFLTLSCSSPSAAKLYFQKKKPAQIGLKIKF